MKRQIPFWGLTLLACLPAMADLIPIGEPTPSYLSQTSPVDFTGPDGTVVSSTTNGIETLSYSSPLTEYTVPTTWTTWNVPPHVESSTPRVGSTAPATSLTILLSLPADTFGVEVQPDLYQVERIDVDFFTSAGLAGSIDLAVDGYKGARLFAATTQTSPFTRITITDLAGDDFAIAQQRYESPVPVPEPPSWAVVACVLVGVIAGSTAFATNRRRRANTATP
jgi:hypothetical protein